MSEEYDAADDLNRLSDEIHKADQELRDNKKYQNEEYPARMFRDNSEQAIGISVKDLVINPNDPPDFFITVNGERVNLEVTALGEDIVFQRNSFFDAIASVAKPVIEKNLNLLPLGFYLIHYYPGAKEVSNSIGMTIDVPEFVARMGKAEIEQQLEIRIPEMFRSFNKEMENSCDLTDKKGNVVGQIRVSWYERDSRGYMFHPVKLIRLEPWTRVEFQSVVRKAVKRKEMEYSGRSHIKDSAGIEPWWLLISDIRNTIGTDNARFDIPHGEVASKLFSRIFLINSVITNYRIIAF